MSSKTACAYFFFRDTAKAQKKPSSHASRVLGLLGRIVRAPVSVGRMAGGTFIVQLKGRNDLAVASLWAEKKKMHRMREKVFFFWLVLTGCSKVKGRSLL